MSFDRILHFIRGSIIFIFVSLLFNNPEAGMAAVIIDGIAKELYDKYIKKTFFDVYDMMATWSGGVYLYLLTYIVTLQ